MDGLSIAALVCSLTCCAAPVGIGLGIAGVVRTRGGARRGRWAAVTALVVGSVVLVLGAAFVVFAAVMGANTVWEDEAEVGQCVDLDFFDDLAKAECDEPHEGEVVAVDRFDRELLRRFDDLSTADFCAGLDLRPEHAAALDDGSYDAEISIDAFDEDDPDEDDWFVCYLVPADGGEITGRIGEESGTSA